VFTARGSAYIEDKGELWNVTFDNALRDPEDTNPMPWTKDGKLSYKSVTITMRKSNGEIVDFPGDPRQSPVSYCVSCHQ
jgi:hypothetical protein